jgi:hypothetical protein
MVFLKLFILFSAFTSLITGILFIYSPRVLLRGSELFNMVFELDKQTLHYRLGVGICLFFIGIFLFFMAYYYSVQGLR